MARSRGFLNGIGIGLIVGAILLQLMNVFVQAGQVNKSPAATAPLSIDELEAIATEHGYRLTASDQQIYLQADVDLLLQEEKAQALAANSTKEPGKMVRGITIVKGMNSKDIADLLFLAGIIADTAQFEVELENRVLDTKIIAGNYIFENKPSDEQIIAQITKP